MQEEEEEVISFFRNHILLRALRRTGITQITQISISSFIRGKITL